MDKIRGKIVSVIQISILIIAFVIINIVYSNYIGRNKIVEQSGRDYLDREEFEFSDIFLDENDYIEQKFRPLQSGLDSIRIRLAVNYAGLKDDFLVLIELCEGDTVLQYEEISNVQIRNWRYYNFKVIGELDVDKEYSIRMRQLVGPCKDGSNEYWISYVIFHAIEHIEENEPCYYYNGERVDGEFEVCYMYSRTNIGLIVWQIAADILFIALSGILLIFKRRGLISEKAKKIIASILYFVLPVIVFSAVEVIAGNLVTIKGWNIVKNLLLYYVVLFLLSFVFRSMSSLSAVYILVCTVLGLVQYFVLLFRGRVFTIQDIFAWRTAATVAGTYVYQITLPVFISLMILLYLLCVGMQMKIRVFAAWKKALFVICSLCAIAVCGMAGDGFLTEIEMWRLALNYQEGGMLLTLVSEVPYLIGDKPDGYSVKAVESIMAEIDWPEEQAGTVIPENVILIMNESLADLDYIGKISTTTEILPYIHGMNENVIKGYVNVPVFGAGTSNTEYEVLTGNSMAFLVAESNAYQMNVFQDEYGLTSTLKDQDFGTVAVHPYFADGWNRPAVYSYMGFDEFLSEDNWGEDMQKFRWWATDREAYKKVINTYEEAEGKFFAFLVTMQNHGSYAVEWEDFKNTVELEYDTEYPQAEQYLTLLRESDKAFEELIEYFTVVEEPTMIIMFGDHQAAIEEGFYEKLFGRPLSQLSFEEMQDRYVTPLIIWTNYDIEEKYDIRMSTNYLGSYILMAAGLEMTPYNKFLLNLWKEIPIIGSGGICDKSGRWYQWNEMPENYEKLIEKYKILQYNDVYDRKNRVESLFVTEERLLE